MQTRTEQLQNLETGEISNTSTRSERMNAIVQRSYGSADVLKQETVNVPGVDNKEVLVEVHAAGLDRGTWHLMTGTPYLIRVLGFGLTKPKQQIPGLDVAGRVHAIGEDVTRFVPGQAVYGIANGSFAEYAVACEDKLVLKPDDLSYDSAAAATVSGITALEALTDVGNVKPGQHVLVVGASGGVGTYAVQLAKAMDAEVSAVASGAKAGLVRSLGADYFIDYRTSYLTAGEQQYDLIIDIGGRNRISDLRQVLKPNGTLVFVGGEGGNRFTGGIGRQIWGVFLSPFVNQNLKMFVSGEKLSMISRLNEFLMSGAVKPSVGKQFTLAEVPLAISELVSGIASGKSVIRVRENLVDGSV